MNYNTDTILNNDYDRYQRSIADAEWKEQEAMCRKCGSWRETDLDGTVINMACKTCDELEHQEWVNLRNETLG